MKPEIAELWATELETGRHEQTKEVLNDGTGKCCLGVLCELAIQAGVPIGVYEVWHEFRDGSASMVKAYDTESTIPPMEVLKWAGFQLERNLNQANGTFTYDTGDRANLAFLNDNGMTFTEIAAVIRKYHGSI